MTFGPKIAGQQSMRIARKRIWEAERIGWTALAESWRATLRRLERDAKQNR